MHVFGVRYCFNVNILNVKFKESRLLKYIWKWKLYYIASHCVVFAAVRTSYPKRIFKSCCTGLGKLALCHNHFTKLDEIAKPAKHYNFF